MKQIRNRLTYANVMSSIAVFLILGGATAFAAKKFGANNLKPNSVTTAKVKKEAITTSKIKKDAVTGAKVKESTLAEVPSATNATNAANANTVGGQSVTKVFAKVAKSSTNVQIASFAGFTITVDCTATGNVDNLLVHAPAGVGDELKAQGNGNNGPIFNHDQSPDPVEVSLDEAGATNNDRGESTFSGATTTGTVVSGMIGFDDTNTFNEEPTCAIYGEVLSG